MTADTVRGAPPLAFAADRTAPHPFSLSSLGHTCLVANLLKLNIGSIQPEVNTFPS